MSLNRCVTLLCLCVGVVLSAPSPTRLQRPSLTRRDDANPTICGDIIGSVNEGNNIFYAGDAYDCLISVPFNDAVALRFIEYYNTSIAFQSNLAYLKNPPRNYQQPAVDVFQELHNIKKNVTSGVYKTQYAFEADMQHLVYRMHDSHVDLNSGILAAFSFASPFNLVSVSIDGKELPQLYLKRDVAARQEGQKYEISPIATINGENAIDYLSRIAALNSVGMLEPNADWNSMMASPAQDIQGVLNTFGGGLTFYPGDDDSGDELNFKLKNGTTVETYWLAIYAEPYYTGPLTTGGDFFNYFVLGILPDSFDPNNQPGVWGNSSTATGDNSDTDDTVTASLPDAGGITIPANISSAYPDDPDVVQPNWDVSGGGVVTGYFLEDISTAVLSIPSFRQFGWDIGNFSDAVGDFITKAKAAKMSKVVIDLQQNSGGLVELAFVTFKQFFPDKVPFAGSWRRSHELANILGETFTKEFQSLDADDEDVPDFESSEWVMTVRLNAETGKNFSSWAEYYGPRNINGDSISLTERYDLANPVFDAANFDGWVPTAYTADAKHTPDPQPWDAKDIVLLTDGICASTCSLLTEMMTQAGVRSVAIGGRPQIGAMQSASGSRGAIHYSASTLDDDFALASNLSTAAAAKLPQIRDTGMLVNYAGFTLRDQVRDKDEIPLQFRYVPADCRLFFTVDNVFNLTRMWRDASAAAFTDQSLCVTGSTGFTAAVAGTGQTTSLTLVPEGNKAPATLALDFNDPGPDFDLLVDQPSALADDKSPPSKQVALKKCDPKKGNSDCVDLVNQPCEPVAFRCPNGKAVETHLCVPRCNNGGGYCPGDKLTCGYKTKSSSGQVTFGASKKKSSASLTDSFRTGYCVPLQGTKALGCRDAKT